MLTVARLMPLSESMDQPLWQNWLNIAFIAFIARRAGVALALQWETLPTPQRAVDLAVLAACLFAGVAVWLSTRWVIASLSVLAALFTVASITELAAVQPALRPWIIAQGLLALFFGAVLIKLAHQNQSQT